MADQEQHHPLRPLLRNWVWEHGHVGTRYLDCVDGEIKFDDGKKSRFASEECFVVSLAKEVDAASRASAPPINEARLARFLRAAQLGKAEDGGTPQDVQHAVQDCIEIGLICAYQAEARRALAQYAQEPMFDDEIRDAAVDDVRRLFVPLREQMALYDFTIFHGLPVPLLISEAPFIDWRVRARPVQPFVSLPLGPYCLLIGTPSGKTSRAGAVTWKAAPAMGPFKDHNRYIAESARRWLVATTDEQLAALQSALAPAAGKDPVAGNP